MTAKELHILQQHYRAVFDSLSGQEVLKHLKKISHIHESTYVMGDSHQTAFREGHRHIVLSILNFLERDYSHIHQKNQITHDA